MSNEKLAHDLAAARTIIKRISDFQALDTRAVAMAMVEEAARRVRETAGGFSDLLNMANAAWDILRGQLPRE